MEKKNEEEEDLFNTDVGILAKFMSSLHFSCIGKYLKMNYGQQLKLTSAFNVTLAFSKGVFTCARGRNGFAWAGGI